ncbi:hypothetical protein M405DRAFT_835125, partial [Rhizopogon salebrosus TDB-379]
MLDRVLDAFHEQELSIESRTSHAFILNEHTWFNSSHPNIGKSPRRRTTRVKQRWYHSDAYLAIVSN